MTKYREIIFLRFFARKPTALAVGVVKKTANWHTPPIRWSVPVWIRTSCAEEYRGLHLRSHDSTGPIAKTGRLRRTIPRTTSWYSLRRSRKERRICTTTRRRFAGSRAHITGFEKTILERIGLFIMRRRRNYTDDTKKLLIKHVPSDDTLDPGDRSRTQSAPPRNHTGYAVVSDNMILGRYVHYDTARNNSRAGIVLQFKDALKRGYPLSPDLVKGAKASARKARISKTLNRSLNVNNS